MKPIVPGCLALMLERQFSKIKGGIRIPSFLLPSHQVTVVEKFDNAEIVCWECGTLNNKWTVHSPLIAQINEQFHVCKCYLIRIDGGDPDAITETEKELTV